MGPVIIEGVILKDEVIQEGIENFFIEHLKAKLQLGLILNPNGVQFQFKQLPHKVW